MAINKNVKKKLKKEAALKQNGTGWKLAAVTAVILAVGVTATACGTKNDIQDTNTYEATYSKENGFDLNLSSDISINEKGNTITTKTKDITTTVTKDSKESITSIDFANIARVNVKVNQSGIESMDILMKLDDNSHKNVLSFSKDGGFVTKGQGSVVSSNGDTTTLTHGSTKIEFTANTITFNAGTDENGNSVNDCKITINKGRITVGEVTTVEPPKITFERNDTTVTITPSNTDVQTNATTNNKKDFVIKTQQGTSINIKQDFSFSITGSSKSEQVKNEDGSFTIKEAGQEMSITHSNETSSEIGSYVEAKLYNTTLNYSANEGLDIKKCDDNGNEIYSISYGGNTNSSLIFSVNNGIEKVSTLSAELQ